MCGKKRLFFFNRVSSFLPSVTKNNLFGSEYDELLGFFGQNGPEKDATKVKVIRFSMLP